MFVKDQLLKRGYWRVNFKDDPENPGGGGADGGEPESNTGDPAQGDPNGGTPPGDGEGDDGDDGGESKGAKGKGDNAPSDREAALLKEVMQRKEQQKQLKAELEAIKSKASQFEGIDLDEVKKMLKDREAQEEKALEAKGEWERLKAKMAEQHKTQVSEYQKKIDELQAQLGQTGTVIEKLTVGHSFDSSNYIKDELTLTPSKARIIYGDYFDIEDGSLVAYDKPRGSKDRTPLVNSVGDNLAFDEALRKIVDADPDKDALIRVKMKPGSGGKSTNEKPTQQIRNLSPREKIAAGLAKQ